MSNPNGDFEVKKHSVTKDDTPEGMGLTMWNFSLASPLGGRSDLPAFWSRQRDAALRATIYRESLWASSVHIAVTKMASQGWELRGTQRRVLARWQELLLAADGGQSWVSFLQKQLMDYTTTGNGEFVEIVRASNARGSRIIGLMHLDSLRMTRTGDLRTPYLYRDRYNRLHEIKYWQCISLADMPDPSEMWFGTGHCLHGETLIRLANGTTRKIRDLVAEQYGGDVLSIGADGRIKASRVTNWYANPIGERQMLNLRGEGTSDSTASVWLTDDHPVLTVNGYRNAGDLGRGAALVVVPELDAAPAVSQLYSAVVSSGIPPDGAQQTVYCIDVAGTHNFITASGIVVHNCAAERAWNPIKKMSAMEQFLYEKVSGRRSLAIHIVNGMSELQFRNAVTAASEEASQKGAIVYMGSTVIPVQGDIPPVLVTIPLASIPNGFDRKQEFDIGVLQYADALGIDVQDIQPLTGRAVGTGAQSRVLDDKSAGKGLAAWRSKFSHMLNEYVTPDSVTFYFYERDYTERQREADIRATNAGTVSGMVKDKLLVPLQGQQLLVDWDVLPKSMLPQYGDTDETLADDEKPEPPPSPEQVARAEEMQRQLEELNNQTENNEAVQADAQQVVVPEPKNPLAGARVVIGKKEYDLPVEMADGEDVSARLTDINTAIARLSQQWEITQREKAMVAPVHAEMVTLDVVPT